MDELAERLARAGFVAAEEEAEELRARAGDDAELLEALIARRLTGEPLAWITGTAPFCGLWIRVDPGVYVPRWQTEPLARRAAELLPENGLAFDLCTGSGAIAAFLKARRPHARILATDIDERAVACARRNGVEATRATCCAGLHGQADVITAVVPYVPTPDLPLLQRDTFTFESPLSYDGGPDGTGILRRVIDGARPPAGGTLLLELGGEQAQALRPALERLGYHDITMLTDEEQDVRGIGCRFPRTPVRLMRDHPPQEDAMKYMLLIHQGTTPTPRPRGLGRALRGGAAARSTPPTRRSTQTPGVTPGHQLQPPETATTVRVQDGRTLTTDGPFVETKEALGGYFIFEADDLDAAIELAARIPAARMGGGDRGPPDRGVVAILDQVFREQWGRVLAALIGFLGDFDLAEEAAQEAFAIAAERWPREGVPSNPGRLADHDRAQPRDRPHPPRAHAGREDAAARGARGRARTTMDDDDASPTSGSSSSSPAATRRWRPTRRSRSRCARSAG